MPRLRNYMGRGLVKDKAPMPVNLTMDCVCDLMGICKCIKKRLAECRGEICEEDKAKTKPAELE